MMSSTTTGSENTRRHLTRARICRLTSVIRSTWVPLMHRVTCSFNWTSCTDPGSSKNGVRLLAGLNTRRMLRTALTGGDGRTSHLCHFTRCSTLGGVSRQELLCWTLKRKICRTSFTELLKWWKDFLKHLRIQTWSFVSDENWRRYSTGGSRQDLQESHVASHVRSSRFVQLRFEATWIEPEQSIKSVREGRKAIVEKELNRYQEVHQTRQHCSLSSATNVKCVELAVASPGRRE